MHREHRPDEMEHGEVGAFGVPSEAVPDERPLIAFTALLGGLIGLDLLLGATGWGPSRYPRGLSPVMIAALLGSVYIVHGALRALLTGRIGADLALAQACLAALVIGEPFVAAEVVFIALLGEVLEAWTFAHARRALGGLVERAPRTARVRRDGAEIELPVEQVRIGDRVIVRPGDRVPVDGTVHSGRSTIDQSALTGEPLPCDKGPGDPVHAGTINQFGAIEIDAEKIGVDTTYGQVLRLVAQARRKRARLEKTADRLARYFLPMVELAALATYLMGQFAGWPDVWSRTVAVLVVACPCGLVLATPAAMLAALAWLARRGALIKGGSALEALAACDTFAFDKTGTLTLGRPRFQSLIAIDDGRDEQEILRLAASAASASGHPLSRIVVEEARRRALALFEPRDAVVAPGAGVFARCGAAHAENEPGALDENVPHEVLLGNRRLLEDRGVAPGAAIEKALARLDERGETALIVAIDGAAVAAIGVHDAVRPEAHDVVHDLRHLGVKEVAVLTGDRAPAARRAAKSVHADTVAAELSPLDKARWVEERQAAGRKVAMIGDGINDAPALARADVGVAVGGLGADLAAEAGGIVLLGASPRPLPEIVGLARATVAVIRQNIIGFAFGFNALAMLSATFGLLGPVAAAVMHQVGSLLVLLNSMRLLAHGGWSDLPPARALRALGARIARFDDRFDAPALARRAWRGRRPAARALAIGLMLVYAFSGFTAIGPGEAGVLQRFGRYRATLGPGPRLCWPFPIERVQKVAVDRVRSLEIGFRSAARPRDDADDDTNARFDERADDRENGDNAGAGLGVGWGSLHDRASDGPLEDEALLLTGDGRYIEMTAVLQYTIDGADPDAARRFLFEVADADEALRPLAESAVRAVVARRELLELLTTGRAAAERAATDLLSERLRDYGFGLKARALAFLDVHPPLAVLDAYRDVSRAASDRQRRTNEALALRESELAEARGRSTALGQAAEAERARLVARAEGAADRFKAIEEARRAAPALTDLRLFWKTVAEALEHKDKLVFDAAASRSGRLILPGPPWAPSLPMADAILPIDADVKGDANPRSAADAPRGGPALRKAQP